MAITIRPLHTQADINSPDRAASLLVMLGPPNVQPLECPWVFEFSIYCSDVQKKGKDCETITPRALLWYQGSVFSKYKHAVATRKCRFDELAPSSIAIRVDPKEKDPDSLLWVRERHSHFRMIRNHFYHLTITFPHGDTVYRYVRQSGWHFTLFLLTKHVETNEITLTRRFTNFSTAWVNGLEPAASPAELKMAEEQEKVPEWRRLPPEGIAIGIVAPHQMAAMLQPIGTSLPAVAPPAPAPLPTRAVTDCTWKTDILTKQDKYAPPEYDDIKGLVKLPPMFKLGAPLESLIVFKDGDGSLAASINHLQRSFRAHASDRTSPIREQATVITNTFNAIAQLPGWQHVQDFISDRQNALSRTVKMPENGYWAQGVQLLTRFCVRIAWLLQLRDSATSWETAAPAMMFYIASDRKWEFDAREFMKDADLWVTQLLTQNATKFAKFRDLQKQGVAWPHGPAVLAAIEKAGLVFRPMMIKRDRVMCDTCLVEVSGWQVWYDPWDYHDYSRHPPSFRRPS